MRKSKNKFSNASKLQQSHVQTANIAVRSERRVQCTILCSGGERIPPENLFLKKYPNENFGQEMWSI